MTNGAICEFSTAARGRPADELLLVPLPTQPEPAMPFVSRVDAASGGGLTALRRAGAVGEEAGHLSTTICGGPHRRLLAVSLGDSAQLTLATLRKAAAAATRWLTSERIERVCLWAEALDLLEVSDGVAEWCAAMATSAFRFDELRERDKRALAAVRVRLAGLSDANQGRIGAAVAEATQIAAAANYARAIAHRPANIVNPESLAAEARRLARGSGLKCTVLTEEPLKRLGMNGLLAVGAGATPGPCLIRLEYRGAPRAKSNTVLVGKAITFDTGGYSIKPAQGLEGMKFDKCGGTTVLGVLRAVADLRLKCNVIGLVAAAENAISDRAYRPGDVIRMMSGKTVEIISTDAEGRMVLADALWYAQTHCKPTEIIDLATLTGGVGIALGRAAAGLMSNDDALAGALGESGRRTHERLWRLPLWDDYKELIRGVDSDIRNSSNKREAHAIVGGMFLKEFVRNGMPWAHLDIASTAAEENGNSLYAKGATGFGVRLLVDYLKRRGS
ncbi:MAG: Cytosol aminopeptidase [Phycisphaerae bacterium]|nr:Cytosol aminopeptidase [Phycisphaerae bacterium]